MNRGESRTQTQTCQSRLSRSHRRLIVFVMQQVATPGKGDAVEIRGSGCVREWLSVLQASAAHNNQLLLVNTSAFNKTGERDAFVLIYFSQTGNASTSSS